MSSFEPHRMDERGSSCSGCSALAYFITFRCYGTWLHGDVRGAIDRKGHNTPGTELLRPSKRLEAWQAVHLKHPPFALDAARRAVVERTVVQVCTHRGWELHALNVRTNHVHQVLTADTSPERVMNTLKAWSTRRMREADLLSPDVKPWSRHGSTRYLFTPHAVEAACQYALEGQGADLPLQLPEVEPLPNGRGTVSSSRKTG